MWLMVKKTPVKEDKIFANKIALTSTTQTRLRSFFEFCLVLPPNCLVLPPNWQRTCWNIFFPSFLSVWQRIVFIHRRYEICLPNISPPCCTFLLLTSHPLSKSTRQRYFLKSFLLNRNEIEKHILYIMSVGPWQIPKRSFLLVKEKHRPWSLLWKNFESTCYSPFHSKLLLLIKRFGILFQKKDIHECLAGWLVFLAEYDYTIEYQSGKRNAPADLLCRLYYGEVVKKDILRETWRISLFLLKHFLDCNHTFCLLRSIIWFFL